MTIRLNFMQAVSYLVVFVLLAVVSAAYSAVPKDTKAESWQDSVEQTSGVTEMRQGFQELSSGRYQASIDRLARIGSRVGRFAPPYESARKDNNVAVLFAMTALTCKSPLMRDKLLEKAQGYLSQAAQSAPPQDQLFFQFIGRKNRAVVLREQGMMVAADRLDLQADSSLEER